MELNKFQLLTKANGQSLTELFAIAQIGFAGGNEGNRRQVNEKVHLQTIFLIQMEC